MVFLPISSCGLRIRVLPEMQTTARVWASNINVFLASLLSPPNIDLLLTVINWRTSLVPMIGGEVDYSTSVCCLLVRLIEMIFNVGKHQEHLEKMWSINEHLCVSH